MIVLISLVGFLIIAMIVSFDVAGLTVAKSNYYASNPEKLKSWSLLNGFWHAFLLAIYGAIIAGLFDFLDINLEFFYKIIEPLKIYTYFQHVLDVVAFLIEHIPVITGVIAIAVIWVTYRDKITDVPSSANRGELGYFPSRCFDLVELIIRLFGRQKTQSEIALILRSNVEAALVAVDMLALALLANRLGMMENFSYIIFFSFSVFLVVSGICYKVGVWSSKYFKDDDIKPRIAQHSFAAKGTVTLEVNLLQKQWWLVSLRLLEPWLIFYFALELLSVLLFGKQTHSPGYIAGTTLMLYAVVKSRGLSNIIKAALATDSVYRNGLAHQPYELRPFSEIIFGLLVFIVGILLSIPIIIGACVISLSFIWELYISVIESDPALDSMVYAVLIIATTLATLFQFVSDNIKLLIAKTFDWLDKNYYAFLFSMSALLIAVAVPMFHQVSSEIANTQSLESNNFSLINMLITESNLHALQVLFSLTWVFGLSIFIPFTKPNILAGVGRFKKSSITWEEIIDNHSKDHVLLWPMLVTIFTMVIMMLINQNIYTYFVAMR